MKAASRHAFARGVLVLLLALTALPAATPRRAHAAIRPGATVPQVLFPADAATVQETAVRFAWTPARGAPRHFLLWSRGPFDTRGWAGLPAASAVTVRELRRPAAGIDDLGLRLDADTRLWWAVADGDPGRGRLAFSSVRSCLVRRRFANRVEPSPLLSVSPIGQATPPAAPGAYRIRLRAGFEIDPAAGEPALPAALRASAAPAPGARGYLVFYGDTDPGQARRSVLDAGGVVVAYIPDHTFLVRAGASVPFAADGAWVGTFQPAYKLAPELAGDAGSPREATVLLFPDGDLDAVQASARAAGVTVEHTSSNGLNKLMRVSATTTALAALAGHEDVAWIEPWIQPTMDNSSAQWVLQTSASGERRVWDMGLEGEGQVVMTSDSGVNTYHNMFRDPVAPINGYGSYPDDRKIIAYLPGNSDPLVAFGDHGVYHGTHTAGSICGNDDSVGTSPNDGMAKNAKLFFEDISGPWLGNSVLPPLDLNDLYQPSYDGNAGGAARLSSNSWGSANHGVYDSNALEVDQFMWNHPDYLIFFSNGNSGSAAGSVGSPAVAKNCAGVGGVVNGLSEDLLFASGSRGPTQDGRRKPTICGVGQNVVSAYTGLANEQRLSGTSMASPTATGTAALMRQYLTEGWYPTGAKVPPNGFTPSAALMKAMCINSGTNLTAYRAPDDNIGWGRIDADSVLYFDGDDRRLLIVDNTAGLGHGQYIDYRINVVDGSQPLKVSLCWTDYPGSPAVTTQLVNDLDLTVSNDTTTYLGNVFDPDWGVSVTGGLRDSLNVEEGVRVATPLAAGVWTVRVYGRNVPVGPQPFALVITGGVGTGAGTLALDRAQYGSASTVQLRVTDTDAGDSVDVQVASTSEPAGETVTLTGANGILTGSIALSPFAGSVGDHVLQVSSGDTLTATYTDLSPAATMVATAAVDFDAPVITGVHADDAGSRSELVSWLTSRNASSRVEFGTTTALGDSTALDSTAVFAHAVTLSGLSPGQTYCFDVESQDLNGNVTRDDNGGQHYRFTVGPPADLLLVYDGDGFEQADRYARALGALGWSYDVWTGSRSQNPVLGDTTSGMRAYRAVWWQNGLDHYPPFSDAAQAVLTQYLDGGGRLAVNGHDLGWANQDPTSPYYTAARSAWMQGTLHAQYVADADGWTDVAGVPGDPISGTFIAGLPYAQSRAGAAGDVVSAVPGDGTAVENWLDPLASSCGLRWESAVPQGVAGNGIWGGTVSRLAGHFFEWSGIDTANADSPLRNAVLDSALVWLVGRGKPVVAVLAPNGGELVTGDTLAVAWSESTATGTAVDRRTLEFSLDGGQSWTVAADTLGPPPYAWALGDVPNSDRALVRVRLRDDGVPSLSAQDRSDAMFSIRREGGDRIGPAVVAGSIHCAPNPVDNTQPASLAATLSDANSGGSAVDAAEWSFGDSAAAPGEGHALAATFGTVTVSATSALETSAFWPGAHALWVRGHDAAGNWGPALGLPIVVNGVNTLGVADTPREFALSPVAPNPVVRDAVLRYALPVAATVDLSVFDVSGRRVRALVRGRVPPGYHSAAWDRTDASGRPVHSGVYFYRLTAAGRTFVRRLITLD